MDINNRITESEEAQISPIEDLMREHGILHRILLIYSAIISQLMGEKYYDPFVIYSASFNASNIAKKFIEDYHQVLEEQFIFPMFLQNQYQIQLIQTLIKQHNAARCLTMKILQLLTSHFEFRTPQCFQLVQLLSSYIQMYEPHSAREDTVVFPAFHNLVSEDIFKELGEKFEEIEEQKFGKNGFQSIVNQVSQIEQLLGIYDLGQYTPKCNL
jgi:hypothetical protein